ncbi:hypothetical protein NGM99_04525 [Mesorhizobium sp. RP14(2022)]|jgi:hypothetical protein|uniref:Uncharacterized protein n=1 Tax=Mesorhizobium liriopis TaxID=2953882 RepID=A0ABT1C4B9_9HYPH|nr:hypothetical protein [Mesorhizobium liriopis]MCO6049055.1 hypothetical protein [Mesorhizobium liriopis]
MTPLTHLLDFIDRPDPDRIAQARRMAVRMTAGMPDIEASAVIHRDLVQCLDAVVEAYGDEKKLLALYGAQERAWTSVVQAELLAQSGNR